MRGAWSLWLILSFIAAGTVLISKLTAAWLGSPQPVLFTNYAVLLLAGVFVIAVAALLAFIIRLAIRREPEPIPLIQAQIRNRLSPAYLMDCIAPLFLTFAFLGAFSSLKTLIPVINPFIWDSFLSSVDRALFFGNDPWRITHLLIGLVGTRFLDTVYALWMPTFATVLFCVSLFAEARFKRRFFLAFVTAWIILGLILATAMSSAGPCFLDLLGDSAAMHYKGLFPLHDAPVATFAQAYLAHSYRGGREALATGISAFPSMHVSIAALYVLAFWRSGIAIRVASIVFYLLILVGSVHLGWHYLIDGIIGTAGTLVIWSLFGDAAPNSLVPTR